MKKILFLFVFCSCFLLLFSGCKKEKIAPLPILPGSEKPIFKVQGLIGQTTIDMVAGVDSTVLETNIEQMNGINFFVGTITQQQKTLTIKISDGNIGVNSNTQFTFPYEIRSPLEIQSWLKATMNDISTQLPITSLEFTLDGVEVGNQLEVYKSGWHDICANIRLTNQKKYQLCNKVLLGYKDLGYFIVQPKKNLSNSTTDLSIENNLSTVSSVKWSIDGIPFSSQHACSIQNNQGVVEVGAQVTFANGIERTHTILVDTDADTSFFPDMHAFIKLENAIYYNDFRASVSFIDHQDNDNAWSPAPHVSDMLCTIHLKSIEKYDKKTNGNTIYKIEGTIYGEYFDPHVDGYVDVHLDIVFAVEAP